MSGVQEKIIEIINLNIETAEITTDQTDDDLSQRGMDSISFIRIIVAIEETFEIEVPDEKLLISEMNTVKKITEVVSVALENKHG